MNISSIYSTKNAATSDTQTGGQATINDSQFMTILLAQLTHQNPLEPMKENEMLGQMTQLNSLQQLQKINTTLEKLIKIVESSQA